MILLGLLSGFVVNVISLPDFDWVSLGAAFVSVFLAGLTSLVIFTVLKRRNVNGAICALAATFARAMIVGTGLAAVVLAQQKNAAFYMLCFLVVFYMGMLPVCTWLTMQPRKQ